MSDAGTALHGVGLRVTAPRVAVLEVLRAGRSAGERLPASADVGCTTGTAPCVVPDPTALPASFVLDAPDPSPTAQEHR